MEYADPKLKPGTYSSLFELVAIGINATSNDIFRWSARTYTKFDGVSLKDGPKYFLGTIQPKEEVVRLNPLLINPDERFDKEYFDSRDEWPNYIQPAMDQGECAASWAFSTAGMHSCTCPKL